MWTTAVADLAGIDRSLAKAMLHLNVLPREIDPSQRVTAILTSQLLSGLTQRPGALHFAQPGGNPANALIAATSLLITDFFHGVQGGERLDGNLLLVTPAIGDSIEHLENLVLEGSELRLSNFWPVDSFSRYQPIQADRPQVIVANPGWITRLASLPGRIGGVIVDATHPRTFSHLEALEKITRDVKHRVFFTPPLAEGELGSLGEGRATWLWSPGARAAITEALGLTRDHMQGGHRDIYVCQDDPEFDQALADCRSQLVSLMGLSGKHPTSELLEAWSIYHRMRQLSIPLQQYEALARRGWGGMMLREQIENLSSVDHSRAALQGPWNDLARFLKKAYEVLDHRAEPAKLFALQTRIRALLDQPGTPLFIVTPTQAEVEGLRTTLSHRMPELVERELSGAVEFMHVAEQARRAHAGEVHRTLLGGYRHGQLRYLDTYPSRASEAILYPHEVLLEQGLDRRTYEALEAFQGSDHLRTTLTSLGVPCRPGDLSTPSSRPELHVLALDGRPLRFAQVIDNSAHLDLDDLVNFELQRLSSQAGRDAVKTGSGQGGHAGPGLQDHMTLHFEDGSITLNSGCIVDVFYPDTGTLVRHRVADVVEGMHVVCMVDDTYSTIFERLVEVLDAKSPTSQRLLLQLWRQAKNALLAKYPSMSALYRDLQQDGLNVEYATLRSWLIEFGNESQHFPPMRLLAQRSGAYPTEQMIQQTFAAITAVRGRNRSAGRALHGVMRAIATGQGYKAALQSARTLDRDLGELLSAAELRHVIRTSSATPRAASA